MTSQSYTSIKLRNALEPEPDALAFSASALRLANWVALRWACLRFRIRANRSRACGEAELSLCWAEALGLTEPSAEAMPIASPNWVVRCDASLFAPNWILHRLLFGMQAPPQA